MPAYSVPAYDEYAAQTESDHLEELHAEALAESEAAYDAALPATRAKYDAYAELSSRLRAGVLSCVEWCEEQDAEQDRIGMLAEAAEEQAWQDAMSARFDEQYQKARATGWED